MSLNCRDLRFTLSEQERTQVRGIGASCGVFHGCNSKQSRVSGCNYKWQHLIEEFLQVYEKNKFLSLKWQHKQNEWKWMSIYCQCQRDSRSSVKSNQSATFILARFLRHALRLPSSCTRFVLRSRKMILTTFFIRRTSLKFIIFLSLASKKLIFNAIKIALPLLPWSDSVMLSLFVSFLSLAKGDRNPVSLSNSDKIHVSCFL